MCLKESLIILCNVCYTQAEDEDEWVGAWWIGFITCACLAFLVAMPLLLFPKQLPNIDKSEQDEEEKPDFASFGAQLKGKLKFIYL